MPAVQLVGVGHRYPKSGWLFQGVSGLFESGALVAVTGPSGSGKSTLLGIIAGAIRPAEGRLERSDDVDRLLWVYQNPHGIPRRSVLDHVTVPILARRPASVDAAEAEALDVLERFDLGHLADRPFMRLSGGEAQRVMLAQAVAAQPTVLLVDEPTAQLDRAAAGEVNSVIRALATDGCIVFVASHDTDTVQSCTTSVAVG